MEFKHTELPIELSLPKLVRDNIPQIIRDNDKVEPTIEVAKDDAKFLHYILKKFVEEAIEMSEEGENREELTKELADIMELVSTLAELENIDLEEVEKIRKLKQEKNGGFKERYILISK